MAHCMLLSRGGGSSPSRSTYKWFDNGIVDESVLGVPQATVQTNGRTNIESYITDGKLEMWSTGSSSGYTLIASNNKLPLDTFSKIRVKGTNPASQYTQPRIGFRATTTVTEWPNVNVYTFTSDGAFEFEIDLTSYNAQTTECYFEIRSNTANASRILEFTEIEFYYALT